MGQNAQKDLKQLRAIGHKLKPLVTVAGKGLTENVMAEIDAALSRHELVKIRFAAGSRDEKQALVSTVCEQTGAELVQSIGKVVLLLRRAEKPDPKLSNLIRPL